jgi:hypothetical protein
MNKHKRLYNISVLAIFKNETMNLKVWLDHYIWQGVDHFYLIDNNSSDNPLKILNNYKSMITYERLDEPYKQVRHYRYMYKKYDIKHRTKWLIMADLDEFWYSPNPSSNLKIELSKCHKYIIYANWFMFGSSGLINHPDDIRTAIINREPDLHLNTKWIIRAKKIKGRYINQHKIRNNIVKDRKIIRDNTNFHLNHYPIQSKEYFDKVKKTRGDVATERFDNIRDDNYFNGYDKNTSFIDEKLANLVKLSS